MLDQLFAPRWLRRYSESPVADWLTRFANWLILSGYARRPAQRHVHRLRKVLERSTPRTPTAKFSTVELLAMFDAPAKQQSFYRSTQRAFQQFLATQDQVITEPSTHLHAALLEAYRQHLLIVRGLAPATIDQHISTIMQFLDEAGPPDVSLQLLRPQDVEQFVLSEGRRVTRQTLQHIVARLRAFLRYCHDNGEIREKLDIIDTAITYRYELPPRALPWSHVQHLLRSIDRSSKAGWRDFAILHLMAHYGLRPSEIVTLTLDSIDWEAKTLCVNQCKSLSLLIIPLSGQTLRMLKRYLHWGRTGSNIHPELFLRARTPAGPLKHTAISDIYRKRTRVSGLDLQGTSSYCLRHSFAMRLLNQGVGIKAIGDLLGHRTLESTCVYLRLNIGALREVALPVPTLPEDHGGNAP